MAAKGCSCPPWLSQYAETIAACGGGAEATRGFYDRLFSPWPRQSQYQSVGAATISSDIAMAEWLQRGRLYYFLCIQSRAAASNTSTQIALFFQKLETFSCFGLQCGLFSSSIYFLETSYGQELFITPAEIFLRVSCKREFGIDFYNCRYLFFLNFWDYRLSSSSNIKLRFSSLEAQPRRLWNSRPGGEPDFQVYEGWRKLAAVRESTRNSSDGWAPAR